MVAEWYCQVMGSEVGPLTQRELVDMVRNHRINPEDLVRRNESSWVAAFEVRGLFEAAAKPPSPSKSAETKPTVAEDSASPVGRTESPHRRPDPPHTDVRASSKLVAKQQTPSCDVEQSTANDWFCIASGEKKGPLRFDELKAMASDGSLRGRDRVWRASWPKFQKAADVDGLDV